MNTKFYTCPVCNANIDEYIDPSKFEFTTDMPHYNQAFKRTITCPKCGNEITIYFPFVDGFYINGKENNKYEYLTLKADILLNNEKVLNLDIAPYLNRHQTLPVPMSRIPISDETNTFYQVAKEAIEENTDIKLKPEDTTTINITMTSRSNEPYSDQEYYCHYIEERLVFDENLTIVKSKEITFEEIAQLLRDKKLTLDAHEGFVTINSPYLMINNIIASTYEYEENWLFVNSRKDLPAYFKTHNINDVIKNFCKELQNQNFDNIRNDKDLYYNYEWASLRQFIDETPFVA